MSAVLGGRLLFGAPFRDAAQPLLYIGFSKALAVCYVGETISRHGILARWCAHLGAAPGGGTFVQRLDDVEPDRLADLVDLTVLYWVLDERLFGTTEASCRRGVEYLVQRRLQEINGVDLRPALRLVANVQSNPSVRLDFVEAAARLICDDFVQSYMTTQP